MDRYRDSKGIGRKTPGSEILSDAAPIHTRARLQQFQQCTLAVDLATGGMNISDIFYRWYNEKLFNADIPASTSDKAEFTKHAKLVAMLKRFLPHGTVLSQKPADTDTAAATISEWQNKLRQLANNMENNVVRGPNGINTEADRCLNKPDRN